MAKIIESLKDKKSLGGFSLVELLIGVAVLSILSAIAIPVFLGQREKAHLTTAKTDGRNLGLEITSVYGSCLSSNSAVTGYDPAKDPGSDPGSFLIPIAGLSPTNCAIDAGEPFQISNDSDVISYYIDNGTVNWCFIIDNNGQKAKYDNSGLVEAGATITTACGA